MQKVNKEKISFCAVNLIKDKLWSVLAFSIWHLNCKWDASVQFKWTHNTDFISVCVTKLKQFKLQWLKYWHLHLEIVETHLTIEQEKNNFREHSLMTSWKFWQFLTPSPPLCPVVKKCLTPSLRDVIYDCSLK